MGTGAVVKWYTGSCGGTLEGTGNPLTISKPTTTTTYYALYDGDCNTTTCASVTVTVNPLPIFNIEVTHVSCYGGNDGSIKVTVTSGTPNYEFSRDGGSNWSTPQESAVYTFSELTVTGGPYNIAVRDGNGCVQTNCTVPGP